jgi:hypothetical protein
MLLFLGVYFSFAQVRLVFCFGFAGFVQRRTTRRTALLQGLDKDEGTRQTAKTKVGRKPGART